MLTRILDHLRAVGRPLCAAELSGPLGIEAAALEGMLETLARMGRLRAHRPPASGCAGCPLGAGCFILGRGLVTSYGLLESPAAGVGAGRPTLAALPVEGRGIVADSQASRTAPTGSRRGDP